MRVKAPNGTILDVPDAIASGLVGGVNHRFEYVDDSATVPGDPPKPYASKPDWVDYAVTRGVPRDEAEALSKNDLIGRLT